MSGVAGRSGVPSTPDHIADKAAAGKASVASRRAKRAARVKGKPPLPVGKPATIDDYDKRLGLPQNWSDAQKREKVQAQINETALKAGQVVSRADAEAAAKGILRRFENAGQVLPGRVVELIGEVSNEIKASVSRAVSSAWQIVLDDVTKSK